MFPNTLSEEDIDVVIEEIVNIKDFEKSDTEIETCESIEELKRRQEYNSDQPIVFNLNGLYRKEMDNPRDQAMVKRSRQNNISKITFSQDYHELSKRTIRAVEKSITSLNQTVSGMLTFSIKIKILWL